MLNGGLVNGQEGVKRVSSGLHSTPFSGNAPWVVTPPNTMTSPMHVLSKGMRNAIKQAHRNETNKQARGTQVLSMDKRLPSLCTPD